MKRLTHAITGLLLTATLLAASPRARWSARSGLTGPDWVGSLVEWGECDGGRERAVATEQPRPAAGNSSCLVGPRPAEEFLEALTRVVSDGVSQHGRRKVPAPQPDHVSAG